MAGRRAVASAFSDASKQLRVGISRHPMKLKGRHGFGDYGRRAEARMYNLRSLVANVVREERVEVSAHKAFESRAYVERVGNSDRNQRGLSNYELHRHLQLLQLAVTRGLQDEYTNEMLHWWMGEELDLMHKITKVLVPRYEGPYLNGNLLRFTSFYRLPDEYTLHQRSMDPRRWYLQYGRPRKMAILELKGNPYPPVVPHPKDNSNSLLNVLLDGAKQRAKAEKETNN